MDYPILLIEVGLSPIDSMAMNRYLMYKHKINNMGNRRIPKIALKPKSKPTTPQVVLVYRYHGLVKPLGN